MKTIVTTTINPPTEALKKFAEKDGWDLIIIGDLKTPHDDYDPFCKDYPNCTYLHPEYQEKKYKKISNLIGWNNIQRRNIGFLEAYERGAEIIATVDDDNIPYEDWGKDLLVGKAVELDCYENTENGFFDPLSVTNISHMFHRGYPIEYLSGRLKNKSLGKIKTRILIQADLWDGHPDIDAMCRLYNSNPSVKITGDFPYTFKGLSVFNSQNTFIHRSVLPHYSVLPHVDRMDDIWGSIIAQKQLPTLGSFVAFNKPSVYQDRSAHSFDGVPCPPVGDLEREILGYKKTFHVCKDWKKHVPAESLEFFIAYQKELLKW